MDDKEREKVIEAIHKWTEKKGIDFGHGWDAEIADFHLAETQELRRQLGEAISVIKHYADGESWARTVPPDIDVYQGDEMFGYDAARAYLDKWRVE